MTEKEAIISDYKRMLTGLYKADLLIIANKAYTLKLPRTSTKEILLEAITNEWWRRMVKFVDENPDCLDFMEKK